MQKIILAMNAVELNLPSIEFACYIAQKTRSKIFAIFLEEVYNEVPAIVINNEVGMAEVQVKMTGSVPVWPLVEKNIDRFKTICQNHGVACSIHLDTGFPLQEIILESRYADLLVTDVNTSLTGKKHEGIPSNFVKDILREAECPVIISPLEFENINEVIFTYDGSESSLFAIKQFVYLFPEFDDTRITLLQVLPANKEEITEKEKLKEWLMMRYNGVHFEVLHGEPEKILFSKYFTQKNKLLVMGAYGRKLFCYRSTADLILKTLDIPVFIAHL